MLTPSVDSRPFHPVHIPSQPVDLSNVPRMAPITLFDNILFASHFPTPVPSSPVKQASSPPLPNISIEPLLDSTDNLGIPVFQPTLEQFQNFPRFVQSIRAYGAKYGLCKIVPPKEWSNALPDYSSLLQEMSKEELDPEVTRSEAYQALKSISITKAITQQFHGSHGCYCQANIESRRVYSVNQFQSLAQSMEHTPPDLHSTLQERQRQTRIRHEQDELMKEASNEEEKRMQHYRFLERLYWRQLSTSQPIYGADLQGSLFPSHVQHWNVAHLDNLLQRLAIPIAGVNTPYLYFGMWKATFAWHLEDMDLYSINYLHFGEPKQWYVIPPEHQTSFERVMRDTFDVHSQQCPEFIRHKTFLICPDQLLKHGIPFRKIIQFPGEFMITFPFAYHAGFNYGFNAAESINFALQDWLEDIGPRARSCMCSKDNVKIDLNDLITEKENKQMKKRKKENLIENGPELKKMKSLFVPAVSDSCFLCLNDSSVEDPANPLLPFDELNSAVAHLQCALMHPELNLKGIRRKAKSMVNFENNRILNEKELKLQGLNRFNGERLKLKCLYCKKASLSSLPQIESETRPENQSETPSRSSDAVATRGSCIQCCYKRCARSFHVPCAVAHQLICGDVKQWQQLARRAPFPVYCSEHLEKMKNEQGSDPILTKPDPLPQTVSQLKIAMPRQKTFVPILPRPSFPVSQPILQQSHTTIAESTASLKKLWPKLNDASMQSLHLDPRFSGLVQPVTAMNRSVSVTATTAAPVPVPTTRPFDRVVWLSPLYQGNTQ